MIAIRLLWSHGLKIQPRYPVAPSEVLTAALFSSVGELIILFCDFYEHAQFFV